MSARSESNLNRASELIEMSLAPSPAVRRSFPRRIVQRFALRLSRPYASHQQRIDRELLEALRGLIVERDQIHDELRHLGEARDELRIWLHDVANRAVALHGWASEQSALVTDLVAAAHAVPGMANLTLERFDVEALGTVLGYSSAGRRADQEKSYLEFENTFRGSEELIGNRQAVYLPLLEGHAPVLDVGCGRGELLELLRDAGISATGVDIDPAMAERCRSKGLVGVVVGDAVGHLRAMPDSSLGAVVAAQVIEHLPYAELLDFIRLSAQKLRPGGRLIVETVNPHAPKALKTFWVDLTHHHPIFPEVTLALCREAGFQRGYVFHPGGDGDAERDRFEIGDYAVVAELEAAR